MSAPNFEFRAPAVRFGANDYETVLKRPLDVLLVLLMLPLAIPVVALCAMIVALSGGRPFYSHPRIGRGGVAFKCWKLRTMVPQADDVLADLLAANPAAAREWESAQKLRHDPRITVFGRFLRRSSLDELPQLWNVLVGQMSLVGPRPFTPEQAHLYCQEARSEDYFRLRPGLTGPWQVSSRNRSTFRERVGFDSDYANNVRLTTDVAILIKTAAVVVRATGQ